LLGLQGGALHPLPIAACAPCGGEIRSVHLFRERVKEMHVEAESGRQDTGSSADRKALLTGFVIARNGAAIRSFADDEGMSREEVQAILREVLAEQEQVGTEIRLGERYDIHTARYSTLGTFIERLLKEG
jgi:hypothetical protein